MVTIINDSRDENAKGRQIARVYRLFQAPTSFIGVKDDIEASGNLVDVLDTYTQTSAVVLVNVAPRNGNAKQWENGTPFGYFWYGKTLVVSTVDGYTLSLVKKLNLTSHIHVFNFQESIDQCVHHALLSSQEAQDMKRTQFRSLRFSPFVAYAAWQNIALSEEIWPISHISDLTPCIWWIDNFGNAKTTLLSSELDTMTHTSLSTSWGKLPIFSFLKDVPDKHAGIITGSSGLNSNRFVEFVGQGFSAASQYNLSTGDYLFR